MEWESLLDRRPIVVAIAGSNGAGKTTFYQAHLGGAGLRFVNADDLAAELNIGAYEAADLATALRKELIDQRESFIFETVFSDPRGAKLAELEEAVRMDAHVVLIFIRIDSPETSKQRVSMRVMQGGHDVPDAKLVARFERTLANLAQAIALLPVVIVFDNSDLSRPYRLEAIYREGERIAALEPGSNP